MREIIGRHALETDGESALPAPSIRTPESREWFLTPEQADKLFSSSHSTETYDPWCYFRHVSNASVPVPWPEHPAGTWHWVTNSLGLREDAELSAAKPALRVLVTGDSHTDGFCDNAEAFPHVAQRALAEGRAASAVEVINAGNGGFNFYNYAGVLERFLELAPDAFVITVYSGNDFQEVMIPWCWFEKTPLPETNAEAEKELESLRALSRPAYGQFFSSLAWFHRHPETFETSVAAAADIVARIRRRCDESGIRFVCVLLPSAIDLPWGDNAQLYESMRLAAGLTPDELRVHDRLADDFLARLRASGCDVLDVRETLRSAEQPCFWQKDLHLNVHGHAVVGKSLAQKLATLGGPFGR